MKRLVVLVAAIFAAGAAPAAADPPVMTGWPGNLTVEATSASGAVVDYKPPVATAGGKSTDVVCNPKPATVFAFGSTNVNCSATSDQGETTTQSFSVTVVDRTGPAFTGASDATIEATGPNGVTGYTAPTARDLVDGVTPSTCTPPPTDALPFGETVVRCTARDTRGNETTGSFKLTVRDNTPPRFENVPDDMHEETDGQEPVVVTYDDPTATDTVDGSAFVSCDPASGDEFPLGTTTVSCTATDLHKNAGVAVFDVVVEDLTAPGPVTAFSAKFAGKVVKLTWRLAAGDVKGVEITRSPGKLGAASALVYKGSARSFSDGSVSAGLKYRYRATSFDAAGNRAKAVVADVAATSSALLAPADGVQLSAPPRLRWIASAGASYYNVQLYRQGRKIFTQWPKRTSLQLPSAWTFDGHRERLTRGVYVWYVWPGLGPLRAARYGALLGRSKFVIVRGPDAA